ncbi:MAG: aminoacetone oxidase family FAD-binding enzyme [Clostridiales bacterium]|nr:MAG: aminoacetone oxidase family FAD-binding enzyme [Clostridiales bacterium]
MIKKTDLIIIGGGAAGLMCGGTAAESGKNILVFEKNKNVGKKLSITGKGRCNVTNNCNRDEFFANVVRNPRFLYSAYSSFTPQDVMEFFENRGVCLKTERGNRVFPVSDRAVDIVKTLEKYCGNQNIIHKEVADLLVENSMIRGIVCTDGEKYFSSSVVLCTGGLSYPGTGSTGKGFELANKYGHTIITPQPALVPLETTNILPLQGLTLKNISLKIIKPNNKKVVYNDFGELLFTHFGVSGPLVLSASSFCENGDLISIDLKPALDEKTLDKRICNDFEKNINRNFQNSLDDLLPKKLIPVIIEKSGITPEKKVNLITKEERRSLVLLLKNFILEIKQKRPINEAIITSGGVSVKEIDPKTMGSKIIKGLYFAGEIIDVDAYTGGFNLQIAFMTARAVGKV